MENQGDFSITPHGGFPCSSGGFHHDWGEATEVEMTSSYEGGDEGPQADLLQEYFNTSSVSV